MELYEEELYGFENSDTRRVYTFLKLVVTVLNGNCNLNEVFNQKKFKHSMIKIYPTIFFHYLTAPAQNKNERTDNFQAQYSL